MDFTENESLLNYYESCLAKRKDLIPKKITLKLIMERNLKGEDSNTDQNTDDKIETKANELMKLTQIHLDRENIDEIDNLIEFLGDVRNLYLQHNLIKKIENLEFFSSLKFLVLSNNRIEKVENLKQLTNLKFLDLSKNLIECFEIDELPKSLSFFDLRENKCILNEEFWQKFLTQSISYFINLIQLNGQDVTDIQKEKNENINYDDSLKEIMEKIIQRSTSRQKNDRETFKKMWIEKKYKLEFIKQEFNTRLSESFQK